MPAFDDADSLPAVRHVGDRVSRTDEYIRYGKQNFPAKLQVSQKRRLLCGGFGHTARFTDDPFRSRRDDNLFAPRKRKDRFG